MWMFQVLSVFAGSGSMGHINASAALSQFRYPYGVCFDASAGGSVICSDFNSVRRIKNGEI
jgi:hypothetical protein